MYQQGCGDSKQRSFLRLAFLPKLEVSQSSDAARGYVYKQLPLTLHVSSLPCERTHGDPGNICCAQRELSCTGSIVIE